MSKPLLSGTMQGDVDALGRELLDYARMRSGRTAAEVLSQKGRDLSIKVGQEFRKLRPARGQIREEAEQRGYRVRVRDSITEAMAENPPRGMNARAAAVKRELAVRARGAGYLSYHWFYRDWRPYRETEGAPRTRRFERQTRQNKTVGAVSERFDGRQDAPQSVLIRSTAEGIQTVDAQHTASRRAISAVRKDTAVYMARKQRERAQKSIRRGIQLARRAVA